MSVNVKVLFSKLLVWLALEIFLSLVGLDNLADYSEFMTAQAAESLNNGIFNTSIALVSLY